MHAALHKDSFNPKKESDVYAERYSERNENPLISLR